MLDSQHTQTSPSIPVNIEKGSECVALAGPSLREERVPATSYGLSQKKTSSVVVGLWVSLDNRRERGKEGGGPLRVGGDWPEQAWVGKLSSRT